MSMSSQRVLPPVLDSLWRGELTEPFICEGNPSLNWPTLIDTDDKPTWAR